MSEPEEKAAPEGGAAMSFLDHLDELRRRLLRVVLVAFVSFGVLFVWSDHILTFLLEPLEEAYGTLSVIRPPEAFLNKMKAALVGALFVSLPYIFFEIWAFVAPGLYPKERRLVVPAVLSASVLFLAGAGFCYWIAMPLAVDFLSGQGEGFVSNITVDYAFSFSTKMLLGLGVVFEGPLVILVLSRMGLVTAGFLLRKFQWAVLIIFILAAIITPTPDVLTQTVFAAPMILLYLLSIGLAWIVQPRRRKPRGGEE
jgi:sec-independent protein translocase protein TatC